MADSKSTRLKRWFRQTLGSQDNTPIPHQTDNCVHHPSVSECASAARAGESQSQPQNPSFPQDLWKPAFDQLLAEEKKALQTSVVSSTTDTINNVIETTKEKYEEYQEKGGIRIRKSTGEEVNIRKVSKKIIDATLSFKEVISAGVACDSTGHAASAWAIVSLGLTMAKNHYDCRDALFESSEYLAEALARCAYIEQKICHNRPDGDDVVTQAIITLYRTILQYAAKVMASHNMSTGGKLLDSVTATTAQYITELRYSIEKEEQKLFHFAQLQAIEEIERITAFTQTQNEKATEEILTAIDDKLSKSLNALNLRFSLPVAANAFWNSYQHEDLCHEDTRVQTRSQIAQWADSVESECIFWLNGGAGTGKSTIARTVAQAFEAKGQLGASFFFKRNEPDRGNARRLIPTITKEIIKQNKDLASGVLKAIEQDPQIAAKDVTEQFNKLLLEPLKNVAMYQSRTLVIVIDALDECENDKEIGTILQFLLRVQEPSSMRLKIFLTSRPELPLRRFFEKESSHQGLILEKIAEEAIKEDIMRFLEHRFAEIGRQANTGKDWPGDEVLEALTTACMPLFISAATICRFIEQSGEDPVERLADILNDQRRYVTKMDKTYGPILDRILRERDEDEQEKQVTRFKRIVGVIILLSVPLPINALSEFVGISARSVEFLLDSFHSVLRIPDEQDLPVRILHLSFRDYLLTTQSRFHVDEGLTQNDMTSHCFRVMNQHLKRDICDLQSFGIQREDIDNKTIRQCVPPHLQYSCRYWVSHLVQSKSPLSETEVLSFLKAHFLHWLEVMSLIGVISETVDMMKTLQSRTYSEDNSEYSEFLIDAHRFILQNIQMANGAPLQLYASGLVFTPTSSLVRQIFGKQHSPWMRALPRIHKSWGANRQTLEGHSCSVQAVAFSSDGRTIASGSTDKTIKLWNAETGEQRQTLEGHSNLVWAVAFSPDDRTIASGSNDKTIKLWNTKTGEQRRTLEGHSNSVLAVTFSPDEQTIASGSNDKTIKLWNVATGEQRQTLEGHLSAVQAVAFSPDSQTIASGSNDKTIKLWNAATGEQRQTLKGHSDSVRAVAFSPDGRTVASGSYDNTIMLWYAEKGEQRQTLEGRSRSVQALAFSPDGRTIASHSGHSTIKLWNTETGEQRQTLEDRLFWVWAMAFSPDGRTIASGSNDGFIQLWNAETGEQRRTKEDHSDSVRAIAFSPDSQTIASGSNDKTIKLWNAATGKQRQTLEGHSASVLAVTFSPDGRTVASGSDDKTIKLWNAATGKQQQTLEGHSDSVRAVAFSPDGRTIASGSDDKTIKLWITATGEQRQTLEGHLSLVQGMAFSPDGQTIASGSDDGTIKLWNAETGEQRQTQEDSSILVHAVALHARDGIHVNPTSDLRTTPHISLADHWVRFGGEKVLWLPSEYRQFSCFATNEDVLALGYRNGRILIIQLLAPK